MESPPVKPKQPIKLGDVDIYSDEREIRGAGGLFLERVLSFISWIFVLFFPLCWFSMCRNIPEYERAVIFTFGRSGDFKEKGPGFFIVNPLTQKVIQIDKRLRTLNVPVQEILTRDGVSVLVDAVINYRVENCVFAVNNIISYEYGTSLLGQTTLRNVLGSQSLSELMSDRDKLSANMQKLLDIATDPWGIKVERVDIKDLRLPTELTRVLAAEAEAHREARAKIIAAEGEKNAATALNEAAQVIASNPAALQLRYLQTLNTIAGEHQSTILFPVPMDMMQPGADKVKTL
ncbi:hypothetical protein LOD99_2453 [Oopsacas minuta]|uniref:Band 7 domain-containing protein n=1 Tax=Oopsacas minuta TaxID=111878 RepID=A0AAV7K383_9METZ|nr:hypothetical protein LOD99_2453 [Oopsacas minuta]